MTGRESVILAQRPIGWIHSLIICAIVPGHGCRMKAGGDSLACDDVRQPLGMTAMGNVGFDTGIDGIFHRRKFRGHPPIEKRPLSSRTWRKASSISATSGINSSLTGSNRPSTLVSKIIFEAPTILANHE